jgi:pimeloyl-ACP methyl ester carboxylesterase
MTSVPGIQEGWASSADGTKIGFIRSGTGPALVIVHGSIQTADAWLPVMSLLSEHFTCYAIDRRGRGRSGDSPDYSLEREYEDIASVLRIAGPDASLLGHSYGAICALGAALQTPVKKLVLYEPPLPVGGIVAGSALDPYRTAVEIGDLDQALNIGLLHFAQEKPENIAFLRQTPAWSPMAALTPTWVRELQEIDALGPDLTRYGKLTMPILLLLGTESAEHPLRDASVALSAALANAQIAPLSGQGHTAHMIAPDLVAEVISQFLSHSTV